MDSTQIIVTIIGTVGSAWGTWLTFRGIRSKNSQDSNVENFASMQGEINRLREDLTERDKQARDNYAEITALRREVHHATSEINRLNMALMEWTTGASVLYRQLVDAEIQPLFVPSQPAPETN